MKTKIIIQLFIVCFLCNASFSQITYVASATKYSNSTTLTINKPTGTGQDDVMLAYIAVEDDDGSVDITPPTGWTLIRDLNNYPYLITYTFYKVAGAAEPTSYTFTRSTASVDMFGAISTYYGVDTSTPIEAEDGQNTAAGNSHDTPSINTISANDMIVCFFAVDYNDGCQTWSPPGGMTQRYQGCGNNGYQSISSTDVIQASAGATGTQTATSSAFGTQGTAQIIALKPGVLIPMSYTSSTSTQGNISTVYKLGANNQILGVQVVTTGSSSPLSVTTFTFNTTGCTNAAADIANAKVFYTSSHNAFSAVAQFGGTVAAPTGIFTFTGSQTLLAGTNYFWLTYDITSGATVGNVVDAQCTALTVTSSRTPTTTNPVGSRPIDVLSFSKSRSIAAGSSHSLAICVNGTINSWGRNNLGELGNNSTTDSPTPVAVSTLTGVVAVAAGFDHSLAVKNNGTAWAWGDNTSGELGDGTAVTQRNAPVQVSGLTGITSIAGGTTHSLALKNDGTVWAWGDNTNGVLGDGTTTPRNPPVQVSSLTGITGIAAGFSHSLAVKNDGTAWAWGSNVNGQLGDGTTTARSTPVQISGLTGVVAVSTGLGVYHSFALKNDGTVWAWGANSLGNLGDGTTTERHIPVQVSGLSSVIDIAAGAYHCTALKIDGTVWAWGNNNLGPLGDGTTTDSYTPIQVSAITGITNIEANSHCMAVKSNATLWAWGDNSGAKIGDGSISTQYVPVQVAGVCGLAILPVELLYFDAHALSKEEKVKLTWATATETNNDYFTLQRSKDAFNWENMKEVNGAGNSINPINYVDYDPSPYAGTSYYRLKQTDFNGQYSYSDIRAINFEGIEIVRAYPVPSGNYLNLMINTYADTDASLELYNAMGQLVLKENKQLILGMNNISINTESFSEGNYLIKVQTADLLYSDKIMFIIK